MVHDVTGTKLRREGVVVRMEGHIHQALSQLSVRFVRTGPGEYAARMQYVGQAIERRSFTAADLAVPAGAPPVLLFDIIWVDIAALRRYLDRVFRKTSKKVVKPRKMASLAAKV